MLKEGGTPKYNTIGKVEEGMSGASSGNFRSKFVRRVASTERSGKLCGIQDG